MINGHTKTDEINIGKMTKELNMRKKKRTKKEVQQAELTKKESLEEFLARGGNITVVPAREKPSEDAVVVKPTNLGPPALFSLNKSTFFDTEFEPFEMSS